MNSKEIIDYLKSEASEKYKENVIKMGIPEKFCIGVSTSTLRKFAKKLDKSNELAFELWNTHYHEARLLAVLIFDHKCLSYDQIDTLMSEVLSWDLCDHLCKNLIIKLDYYEDFIFNWIAADHIYTEKAIEKSGIAHTFLRNNWYFENEMPIIAAALSTGKFVYNAPTGKVGWALKREYAEVGAKALAGADFPEVLELSGKILTYAELAQALKAVSDKEFEVVAADDKTFVSHLVETGLPDFVAELFLGFQKDIEAKDLDVESKDFEKALGHSLTDTKEALKELLA